MFHSFSARPHWHPVSSDTLILGSLVIEPRLDGFDKTQAVVAGVVRFCPQRKTYRPYACTPDGNIHFLKPCYTVEKAKKDLVFFLAQKEGLNQLPSFQLPALA